jgi:hypothetical protein
MKMILKTVTGEEITFSGSVVKDVKSYFTRQENGSYKSLPLGWVSIPNIAVNFDHVVYVKFEEVENND